MVYSIEYTNKATEDLEKICTLEVLTPHHDNAKLEARTIRRGVISTINSTEGLIKRLDGLYVSYTVDRRVEVDVTCSPTGGGEPVKLGKKHVLYEVTILLPKASCGKA